MSVSGSLPPSAEAQAHHAAQLSGGPKSGGAWTGWVTFAAAVLVLLGTMNMFQGFLALFDEGYFVARSDQLVLVNYDVWGVVLLLWGGLLMLVGLGLTGGRSWARWLAALAVMVNVIAQIGFLPAFPLLSVVLITLDVIVLYALTVRWNEAQQGY